MASREHLLPVGLSGILTVVVGAVAALPLLGRAADTGGADAAPIVAPSATGGPVQASLPLPGRRLSGAVFIGYRGSDGETTGAVVTLSPVWHAFARLGTELTPRSPDGGVRFLWGLGFEEARDRSFFLHVHDWGPVRPERELTLRHAEASFGYKLPTVRGGPFRVAVSAFAAAPFDGGPYLGAGTAVTIGRTWFVSTAFGWTVPDVLPGSGDAQPWRLSFALGRWDGRPGGLFVTYSDELSTRQYADWSHLDRHGQGILALGVNWAH